LPVLSGAGTGIRGGAATPYPVTTTDRAACAARPGLLLLVPVLLLALLLLTLRLLALLLLLLPSAALLLIALILLALILLALIILALVCHWSSPCFSHAPKRSTAAGETCSAHASRRKKTGRRDTVPPPGMDRPAVWP